MKIIDEISEFFCSFKNSRIQTEEIITQCKQKVEFFYNEIISCNLEEDYIQNFHIILGYSYRLDDTSQRVFHTFNEAIIAIDLEKLMRNSDGIKLNSIVYILVLKNIFDEYTKNIVDKKLKEEAIMAYKTLEEEKAKENTKYHMYQY